MDQRRSEVQAAAHAARVRARQLGGHVDQTDQLEELVGPASAARPVACDAADRYELQVLATRRQILDGDLLHREADPPTDGRWPARRRRVQDARTTRGRPQGAWSGCGWSSSCRRRSARGRRRTRHVRRSRRCRRAPVRRRIDLDQRFDLDGAEGRRADPSPPSERLHHHQPDDHEQARDAEHGPDGRA